MTLPLDERAAATPVDAFPLVQRVAFYVTLTCNLTCRHCYVDESPAAARLDRGKRTRLVETIASMGKPVDLTGGEPFMVNDIGALVRELVDAGARVSSVFTNATMLRRREYALREIIEAAGPLRWYVSLDGDRQAHDTLRGPGAFEAALAGADKLVSLNQQVFVNTMLHSQVDESALSRLHNVITGHGFQRWRLDTPFTAGAWTENRSEHALAYEDGVALLAGVVGRWATAGMPFELEAGHVLKYLDRTVYFLDSYGPEDPVCPCRTFPVWPNGDVSWCQDLSDPQFVVGNLLTDPLPAVYSAYAPYKTRTVAEVAAANSVCADCSLLSFCGAGCRVGALGDGRGVDDPDPGACRLHTERLYLPVADALRAALAGVPEN